MASVSLWNYYGDKIDNINDNPSDSKSFKYKNDSRENTTTVWK